MKWMAIGCILLLMSAGVATGASSGKAHFSISYKGSWQNFNPVNLGSVLERSYNEIDYYLGTCPEDIKVVIIKKKEMDKLGEYVEAFSAWNKKSSAIVIREETLDDPDSLEVVVKHELCHLGLNNILASKEGKGFEWMEEGICMLLSKEPLDDGKVSRSIMKNGFLTYREIAKSVDSDEYSVTKNGYIQSYSLCKYIATKFGVKTLIDIFKHPGPDFEDAFKDSTGVDFSRTYKEWQYNVMASSARDSRSGVNFQRSIDLNLLGEWDEIMAR
ncbi:peptidase MA family metallohydrolase [Methanooceanicella nereidis]|uniref:peptidase MA family metallohydrolase n=1 Tax=Methanooceanicella nereidis TaxID=2052831 RepID=UPI001E5BFE32|nr:hypothetical protein [Methanocella sp. CWC-04]